MRAWYHFSAPTKSIDSTQEILALGICQFVGSFAGSLPVTASFGRSTVNRASGVKTPFGGIVTGLIVIAACLFLTPHFAYIPTAALAAVIISSVVLTIDIEILLPIWKSKSECITPLVYRKDVFKINTVFLWFQKSISYPTSWLSLSAYCGVSSGEWSSEPCLTCAFFYIHPANPTWSFSGTRYKHGFYPAFGHFKWHGIWILT